MNIRPDFSQKFILSIQGEVQIKLLLLIYENIKKNYNYNTIINNERSNILMNMQHFLRSDIKPEILYLNGFTYIMSNGTVYTRRKLEKYYGLNRTDSIKGDYFLENIHEKYNLKEYKLIYMKEFLKLYGKYLFINEQHKNNFIQSYPELDISPVMQIIKQIPF